MWALISLFLLQPGAAEVTPPQAPSYECVRLELLETARWRCRFEDADLLCDATIEERDALRISCPTDERRLRRPPRSPRAIAAEQTISLLACPERPRWDRTPWPCRADEIDMRCRYIRGWAGDPALVCGTEAFLRDPNRESREIFMGSRDLPQR